jgi:predicted RNase H-like HicB family nuclease
MIMSDKFDGFSVTIIEEDDGDWLAHFVELPHISAAGDAPEEALHELEAAWELLKESYREDAQEIPIAPH